MTLMLRPRHTPKLLSIRTQPHIIRRRRHRSINRRNQLIQLTSPHNLQPIRQPTQLLNISTTNSHNNTLPNSSQQHAGTEQHIRYPKH